jgi:predicted NAD/FAD-binding protein
VFTVEGERAKLRHAEIDGVRRSSYCGAYWRYGFHEDGAWSAERSVRRLLGDRRLRTVA